MPVEIDHGLIALFLHDLDEVQLDVRQGSRVHACGPGVGGRNLPVQDNGHIQMVLSQNFQHEVDFLIGLRNGKGLGEEVGPQLEPCVGGTPEILFHIFVLHQLAGAVAPIAQADHGKVDAGALHGLPVDGSLVGGDVHPGVAGQVLQEQVVVPVKLEAVAVIGVGVRGNGGVFLRLLRGLQNGLRYGKLHLGVDVGQVFRVLISGFFHVWQGNGQGRNEKSRGNDGQGTQYPLGPYALLGRCGYGIQLRGFLGWSFLNWCRRLSGVFQCGHFGGNIQLVIQICVHGVTPFKSVLST